MLGVTSVKTQSIRKINLCQSVKSVYQFTELCTQQFMWKWPYTDFTDQHRSEYLVWQAWLLRVSVVN